MLPTTLPAIAAAGAEDELRDAPLLLHSDACGVAPALVVLLALVDGVAGTRFSVLVVPSVLVTLTVISWELLLLLLLLLLPMTAPSEGEDVC